MSNNNGYLRYLNLDTSNMVKPGGAYQTERALKNVKRIVSSLNPRAQENNSVGYVENLAEAPMRYSSGNVSGNQSEGPTVIPASAAPDAKVAITPLRYGSSGNVSPVSYDVEPEGVVPAASTGSSTGSETSSEYFDYIDELEKNKLESYDQNKQYAEDTYTDALRRAEAARTNAKVEAEALYRQNAANYGIRGEQMLSQGLAGGGYSEFLEGKNMETRAQNYGAADSNYLANVENAKTSYTQMMQDANAKLQDAEYDIINAKKARQDEINAAFEANLENVLNGSYDADTATAIFSIYGELNDEQKASLEAAKEKYLTDEAAKAADAALSAVLSAGGEPTKEMWMNFFRDALKMDYSTALSYANSLYDEDGNYKGSSGTTGTTTGTNASNGGTDIVVGGTANLGTVDSPSSGTIENDTVVSREDAIYATTTGLIDEYATKLNDIGLVLDEKTKQKMREEARVSDDTVEITQYISTDMLVEAIKQAYKNNGAELTNDYIEWIVNDYDPKGTGFVTYPLSGGIPIYVKGFSTNAGKFKDDAFGPRTDLTAGDNINVTVDDVTYHVESGGEVTDENLINTFKNAGILEDGDVFGYQGDIYMFKNGKYYSIRSRQLFYQSDAQALNEAINGHPEGYIWEETLPQTEKAVSVTFDGVTYNIKTSGSAVAIKFVNAESVNDNELFVYKGDLYKRQGDYAIKLKAKSNAEDYNALLEKVKKKRDTTISTAQSS